MKGSKRHPETVFSAALAALFLISAIPAFAAENSTSQADGISAAAYEAAGEYDYTSDRYIETVYDGNSGFGLSAANAVTESADGYIWIATYSGLVRYDRTNFTLFGSGDGLSSSSIRVCFEDSVGRLWVGSNDRGLFVYENGVFTHLYEDTALAQSSVRAVCENRDGNIYAGTTEGLYMIDAHLAVHRLDYFDGEYVLSLASDIHGKVWGTTSGGRGFILQSGGGIERIFERGELSASPLLSVGSAGTGCMYFGTDGSDIIKVTSYRGSTSWDTETLPLICINGIYKSSDDKIWICSDTGLGYFENGIFHELGGLDISESLQNCVCDYEGTLWVTSSRQGVMSLSLGSVATLASATGLTDVTVNAVCFAGGRMFAAANDGLYAYSEADMSPTDAALCAKLSGVRVRGLAADGDILWIATYRDFGVIRYDTSTEEILSVTAASGLASDRVRSVRVLSDGSVCAGTNGGISIISRDGTLQKTYSAADGLSNTTVLSTAEYGGGIWVGTDGGGMFFVKDGKVSSSLLSGLPSGVILRLCPDSGGGLLISSGDYLCRLTADGDVYTIDASFGSGSLLDIIESDGYIYLLRSGCVAKAAAAELLSDSWTADGFSILQKADGLAGSITANSWQAVKGGMLFVCTGSGIFVITQSDSGNDMPAPKAVIAAITVDGTVYRDPYRVISISGDTVRITVEYAVLTERKNVSVSYILDGFENAFTETDARTGTIGYTNLSGGTYTFRISVDGGEEYSVVNVKEKALYEQWYVAAGAVLAALAAIYFIIRLIVHIRMKKLMARQKQYRKITEEALLAISKTIDAKDTYTNGHSRRVAEISRMLALRLGMSKEEAENVYYTGLLHDIGKIGVPRNILNKPSKLTPEEFEQIKKHPETGYNILKDITTIPYISDGAHYHHEKYDGTGYNHGLRGESIPLIARIIAVADACDAMAIGRIYRPPMQRTDIIEELRRCRGSQFDPKIADIMINYLEGLDGKYVFPIHTEKEDSVSGEQKKQ